MTPLEHPVSTISASPSPAAWLPHLVAVLGAPEKDPDLDRWTWQDGDVGVFADKLTHAWQTVAWTPQCSVTLRGQQQPDVFAMLAVIELAGLIEQASEQGGRS